MPHRLYQHDRPSQKRTNLFIMQVFIGDPVNQNKIGQEVFENGNAERSNADELNNAKHRIAQTVGKTLTTTGARFIDVWKDEDNKLFYYEWDNEVGNVKTMLQRNIGMTIKIKLGLV